MFVFGYFKDINSTEKHFLRNVLGKTEYYCNYIVNNIFIEYSTGIFLQKL